MGHNHALPSNPGNQQWVVVIAGIAQERVVMARYSQMVEAFSVVRRDDRRRHRRRHPSEHRRDPEHGYMGWDWWTLGLGYCQGCPL